jgi:hypothetical protein
MKEKKKKKNRNKKKNEEERRTSNAGDSDACGHGEIPSLDFIWLWCNKGTVAIMNRENEWHHQIIDLNSAIKI